MISEFYVFSFGGKENIRIIQRMLNIWFNYTKARMVHVNVYPFTSVCGILPRDPPTAVGALIDQEMDNAKAASSEGSKLVAGSIMGIIR